MATVADYYRILQIPEGSTVAQIKLAYRTRTKQLHPDRNKSATAHTDFILLTEAYEYLSANPTAKISYTTYETTYQYSETTTTETRERAQGYANMQYDDFVQSDYYKQSEALEVVARHFAVAFLAFSLLGSLSFLVFMMGVSGLGVGLLLAVILIPLFKYLAGADGPLDMGALINALRLVLPKYKLIIGLIGIFNLFIFFKIGLQTLLPFALLWKSYLLVLLAACGLWGALLKSNDKFRTYIAPLCLAPSFFSALLLLNFTFSSNPVTEIYKIEHNKTTTINLPNNMYAAYAGVRTFLDYDELRDAQTVTYTFADGLLGIRVMKDYKFE